MHLWPSTRIRDSFKLAYLKKLEWNLHRMESEKNQQKLLDSEAGENSSNPKVQTKILAVFREIAMVLTCCYCCFCCGACLDQEDR